MLFLAILFIGSSSPTLRVAGEAGSVPTNLSGSAGMKIHTSLEHIDLSQSDILQEHLFAPQRMLA